MDGVIESNLLSNVGPYGLAVIALVCIYFLWQRQTQEFTALKDAMKDLLTAAQKSETEQVSARQTMQQQITAFQVEIASTRPTRQEMNDSLDRVTNTVKDIIEPLRDDLAFIKTALLKGDPRK